MTQGYSRAQSAPDPLAALWRAWLACKGPVLWISAKFAAIMAVYFACTFLPFFDNAIKEWTNFLASIASVLLNLLGEKSQVIDNLITSGNFAITVLNACAGIEFAWFYIAAVTAIPARWSHRVPGILIGTPVVLALNLARVMSLYAVGVHFPKAFNLFHEEIWSYILVIGTLGITLAWVGWVLRHEEGENNAA